MAKLTFVDELLFDIHTTIERVGWVIVYVAAQPSWAYTIGLSAGFEHPELVVVGLDSSSAHVGLNHLADRIAAGEALPTEPWSDVDVFGSGKTLPVHPAHWTTDRFTMWVNYYGSLGRTDIPPRAQQIVWPDPAGRLPSSPRFDARLRRLQTLLHRPPRPAARDSTPPPRRSGYRRYRSQ